MRYLLASQKAFTSGQVSDSESSINESDCEALIASSNERSPSKQVVDKILLKIRIRQSWVPLIYLSRLLICRSSRNYKCWVNA